MMRFRYILAVLMSSLIIISGAGVSIINYCCSGCRTEQRCCTSGCAECGQAYHGISQEICKDSGCTAVHYKVDVVKHVQEASTVIPDCTLYCGWLPQFGCLLPAREPAAENIVHSPPRYSVSRRYLALYSVLLI